MVLKYEDTIRATLFISLFLVSQELKVRVGRSEKKIIKIKKKMLNTFFAHFSLKLESEGKKKEKNRKRRRRGRKTDNLLAVPLLL